MNPIYKQMILWSVVATLALAVMLFIPAGTLNYWQGWAYLGTFVTASSLYTLYVAIHDPALMQRRMKAGPSQEKEPAQKVIVVFTLAAFAALMILPPLDYRFGWSPVPWYASIMGDLLVVLSFYVFYLVANTRPPTCASKTAKRSSTTACTPSCAIRCISARCF